MESKIAVEKILRSSCYNDAWIPWKIGTREYYFEGHCLAYRIFAGFFPDKSEHEIYFIYTEVC